MDCKIFISSTFKDMQDERDVIRNEVLPEIYDYALKYGVTMDIVDLRWGIKTDECETSDVASVKILKTCFDEITLCKPFFVGIIGERYGWIPDLNSIKEAIDPSFLESIKLEEKSVTEYEMDYALSTFESDNASFVFCLRDEIKGELTDDEKNVFISNNEADKKRLKKLKEKIKKRCPNNYFSYKTELDNNHHLKLNKFRDDLIKYLKKEIDNRFKDFIKPNNDIEKDMLYQEALVNQKSSFFEGRKLILNGINSFYNSDENILGVYGISGIGKSSLISHLITNDLKDNSTKTIYFLAGVSQDSNFIYNMIVSFIYQLSTILNLEFDANYFDNKYVLENYDDVLNKFYLLLSRAIKEYKIHIYIDALDQFSISNEKGRIEWLKSYYINSLNNKDLKIIFSYINDEDIEKEIILKNINTMELNGITDEDIILISESILRKNKKSFQDRCFTLLQNKKDNDYTCCSNPLYLSLLLQEIINFDAEDFKAIKKLQIQKELQDEDAIYTYIYNIINEAPISLDGEFLSLINKAKSKISSDFVEIVFGIIAMSRNGVREKDIFSISRLLGLEFESADYSYFKKIFKLFFRENNGYINFTHKIIDSILEDYYFNKNKNLADKINKETIKYLNSLDDEDPFKKHEYLYYLKLANDTQGFYTYLNNNIDNEDIFSSFINVYQEFVSKLDEPDSFFVETFLNIDDLDKFIDKVIDNEESANTTLKLLLDILSSNNELTLDDTIDIYYSIARIYYYTKDASIATNYILMAKKLLFKLYKREKTIHKRYKQIYLLYKEVRLSKKYVFEVLRTIKKLINIATKENNGKIINYFKIEYTLTLKIINYKKAKKLFIKGNYLEYDYESLFFDEKTDNIIKYLSTLTSLELYREKDLIDHLKSNIQNDEEINSFLNVLTIKLDEINKELINNETLHLLNIYSYLNRELGEIYVALNDKERALSYYKEAYKVSDIINKIDESSDSVYSLATSTYMIEKLTSERHKESKKYYKKYYKYKKYSIDLMTKNINLVFTIILIAFIFIVFMIIPILIGDNINIFAYRRNEFPLPAFISYLRDYGEVFYFMCGIFFFYEVFDILSLNNNLEPKNKYIKNRLIGFGVMYLLSLILYTVLSINSIDFGLIEYLKYNSAFAINLILGSLSFTYIFVFIKNLSKKSYYLKKVEYKTYNNKILINRSIQSAILVLSSIVFIYLLINKNNIDIFNGGYMYGLPINEISLYIMSIATFIGLILSAHRLIKGVMQK